MPSQVTRNPRPTKPTRKRRTPNGKAETPAGQPGGRKRQGGAAPQANQKNGTLDLVELKDMSIQKLNQIAKDLNVTGTAGLAQARADLQDPADAGREERPDLLRRRSGMPARRLRIPARPGVQLPARPGRRVRFAVADPALRSAHRRHHLRPDSPAQRRRALLRAHQGGRDQLRAAGGSAQQDLFRQSDAALSRRAAEAGNHARQLLRPRDGSADTHRQGAARA